MILYNLILHFAFIYIYIYIDIYICIYILLQTEVFKYKSRQNGNMHVRSVERLCMNRYCIHVHTSVNNTLSAEHTHTACVHRVCSTASKVGRVGVARTYAS